MPTVKDLIATSAAVALASLFVLGTLPASAQQSVRSAVASAATQTPRQDASAPALSCADRYHARLRAIAGQEYAALDTALETITTPNASVPKAWRFWLPVRPRNFSKRRRKDGTIRPIVYRGRVCADERTMRNGRPRCFKWEPATKARIDELTRYVAPLDPAAPRRERRDLRFLNDTIVSKGALTAFKDEGRFFWLVRRAVEELGFYIKQDRSPGLCMGTKTLVSFYKQQMNPLDERIGFVQSLAKRADGRFEAQLKRLQRMESARLESVAKAERKAAAARRKAIRSARAAHPHPLLVPGTIPASLTRLSEQKPAARIQPEGAPGKVGTILAFITPDDPTDEPQLNSGMAVATALDQARAYVDQAREAPPSKARRSRILRALRAVETLMIAEKTAAIYQIYRTAVSDTLTAIRTAHSETCNCR